MQYHNRYDGSACVSVRLSASICLSDWLCVWIRATKCAAKIRDRFVYASVSAGWVSTCLCVCLFLVLSASSYSLSVCLCLYVRLASFPDCVLACLSTYLSKYGRVCIRVTYLASFVKDWFTERSKHFVNASKQKLLFEGGNKLPTQHLGDGITQHISIRVHRARGRIPICVSLRLHVATFRCSLPCLLLFLRWQNLIWNTVSDWLEQLGHDSQLVRAIGS